MRRLRPVSGSCVGHDDRYQEGSSRSSRSLGCLTEQSRAPKVGHDRDRAFPHVSHRVYVVLLA